MNAAALEDPNVQVAAGRASETEWCDCAPGMQAKVLAVDEARNSVEYVIKMAPGCNPGKHRHLCETYAYVLEGKLINHEFGPGDFCYQPHNDVHVEEVGEEGVTLYVSFRGVSETLVEFFGEDGEVCGKFAVSDFAQLLPQ
jgi:quercetin dioxygenase-like cupin family protein